MHLKEKKASMKDQYRKQGGLIWAWGKAQDVLSGLPPAQQWTPCSENMPQARRSVILSTKDWSGEGCYWETTKHHVIWKGYKWNATYWDDEVIAWMPLPEPYKGEES